MSEWSSGSPAYVRVANKLRGRIESGEFSPGDQLPSVSAIQDEYDVSNTTAQSAIRMLKSAGIVASQRGKGVYVRRIQREISRSADYTSPPPEGQTPYRAKSDRIEIAEVVPPADIAEKLGIGAGERALRRSRVMVEDGQFVEIATSYVPVDIARGTELDNVLKIRGSILSALKRLGFPPRHPAIEWVETRMPTADESRILELAPGTPVFRLLRVTKTDGDRPIEVLDVVFSGERYKLEYDLPVHE